MNDALSLAERITTIASLDVKADAIEFQGQWHPWRECADAIGKLGDLLHQYSLGAGTKIGVLLRNRPQHVHAIAAVLGNDCCIVTLNARQPREKTHAELAALELPVVLADPQDWADEELKQSVIDSGALAVELKPGAGMCVLSKFQAEKGPFRQPKPSVAIEMATSGTTGTPKRVVFGSENLKESILGAARLMPGSQNTRRTGGELLLKRGIVVCWAPLLHVSGMWSVVEHLLQGRRICLLEQFEPFEWARVVSAYKPRMAMLSPPVIRMILEAEIPREQLGSLKGVTSGTAPLPPALEHEFEQVYDIPVLPAYGATEFPGRGAGWTLDDHEQFGESKLGSVGRARPGVKLRVVDPESGEPVAAGETGLLELFARSAATPDGEEPEWLRTTDLACLDEDDFLWIKGRADAAIIRGGFKILPEEVVKVLEQHPDVKEASVVGLPDSRLGQVPAAAIVPRDGEKWPSIKDLTAHARKYLTPYQVPTVFKLVEEMPRTPTLKVSMPAVKALFATVDEIM